MDTCVRINATKYFLRIRPLHWILRMQIYLPQNLLHASANYAWNYPPIFQAIFKNTFHHIATPSLIPPVRAIVQWEKQENQLLQVSLLKKWMQTNVDVDLSDNQYDKYASSVNN